MQSCTRKPPCRYSQNEVGKPSQKHCCSDVSHVRLCDQIREARQCQHPTDQTEAQISIERCHSKSSYRRGLLRISSRPFCRRFRRHTTNSSFLTLDRRYGCNFEQHEQPSRSLNRSKLCGAKRKMWKKWHVGVLFACPSSFGNFGERVADAVCQRHATHQRLRLGIRPRASPACSFAADVDRP